MAHAGEADRRVSHHVDREHGGEAALHMVAIFTVLVRKFVAVDLGQRFEHTWMPTYLARDRSVV